MKAARLLRLLLLCLVAASASGCGTLGYYAQLAQGQWQLLASRQPVQKLIDNPSTDAASRDRLRLSQQARDFASAHLDLPDNQSYRLIVPLDRPYVVWNLFATGEFSVEPVTHCFPIAGCVAYQGFYREAAAQKAAARMARQGKDTFVGGVDAYSTLGWFADPLLSNMLAWPEDRLVSLIFHELAHQQFYLKGDTTFNESYASFVEREGLRQWQAAQGRSPQQDNEAALRDGVAALVLQTRERLKNLYRQPLPKESMRRLKAEEFARLRRDYRLWRQRHWPAEHGYDHWVEGDLNNASLLPFRLYDGRVDAFAQLFENSARNWPAFYAAVRRLGRLDTAAREHALDRLAAQAHRHATKPAPTRSP